MLITMCSRTSFRREVKPRSHVMYLQHVKQAGVLVFFFFTFPASSILKTRKDDVSETGCVSVLSLGVGVRRGRLLSWVP